MGLGALGVVVLCGVLVVFVAADVVAVTAFVTQVLVKSVGEKLTSVIR